MNVKLDVKVIGKNQDGTPVLNCIYLVDGAKVFESHKVCDKKTHSIVRPKEIQPLSTIRFLSKKQVQLRQSERHKMLKTIGLPESTFLTHIPKVSHSSLF